MTGTHKLIVSWIEKAEKDLLSDERALDFDDPVTEAVCFHSQQSVEKYMKAYLIFLDIYFPRTHDLGQLGKLIETKDTYFETLKYEADLLSDYAVEIRYPDDFNEPTLDETRNSILIAEKIINYIKQKIELSI